MPCWSGEVRARLGKFECCAMGRGGKDNMQLKKVAIVFNPKGGSASRSKVDALTQQLRSRGIEVSLIATTREPGSAAAHARKAAAHGAELVIAVGGDGTACQVATGLRGTSVPMAVFPGGTGNLFARSFYCLPTIEQFVEMILSGEPQPVDMVRAEYKDMEGKPQQRLFMVGFGIGKVSDAISQASPFFKRLFGQLVYVLRVAIACIWPSSRRFQINLHGAQMAEVAAAVFALNVTPPAMNMLARGCNASDGLIDVVIFRAKSFLGLVAASFWLAIGKPERSRHYRRFRTSELTIQCAKPMRPNIDGDPDAESCEIKLTVEPGAVRMILA
jgi:diacylglycerol kinase family enzyme